MPRVTCGAQGEADDVEAYCSYSRLLQGYWYEIRIGHSQLEVLVAMGSNL